MRPEVRSECLREIPVGQVLLSIGLTPHREGKSVMWKDGSHSINVTGQKWFDHEVGHGAYGAIDLVIHLCGFDFTTAVSWLRNLHQKLPDSALHEEETTVPVSSRQPLSLSITGGTLPAANDMQWLTARRYLVVVRGLGPRLVDSLHASGDIHAVPGGVVFVHRTMEGEVGGSSLRSSWFRKGFRQCQGSKQRAWFSTEGPQFPWNDFDRPVAIVESGIEALSYVRLHSDQTVCISVAGNYVPDKLIEVLGAQPRDVILALNNDAAGRKGIAAALEKFETRGSTLQARITAHLPRLKDWNNDLCAGHRRGISI